MLVSCCCYARYVHFDCVVVKYHIAIGIGDRGMMGSSLNPYLKCVFTSDSHNEETRECVGCNHFFENLLSNKMSI